MAVRPPCSACRNFPASVVFRQGKGEFKLDLIHPHKRSLFRIAVVLATITWLLVVGTVGVALIYIEPFFLFALSAQSGFISHLRGSAVHITPEQYPDLHERLAHCCRVAGITAVPDIYLLRTDFFNALATRFLRRHYIVLFTDILDASEDQPGAINFYIGHELGNIHRNHIRWGWVLAPVLWLPLLGSAYRRAEEYTCDRYGNACCDSTEDAVAAMAAIVAGNSRWPAFNAKAYLSQVAGSGGFWMSLNELTSEYPWLCKRLAWVMALRDGKQPEIPSRNHVQREIPCPVLIQHWARDPSDQWPLADSLTRPRVTRTELVTLCSGRLPGNNQNRCGSLNVRLQRKKCRRYL